MLDIQERSNLGICSRRIDGSGGLEVVPVIITVMILNRNKVRAILEVRKRYRQEVREKYQEKENEINRQIEK